VRTSRRITRPLYEVVNMLDSRGKGDWDVRVGVLTGPLEIQAVAEAVNTAANATARAREHEENIARLRSAVRELGYRIRAELNVQDALGEAVRGLAEIFTVDHLLIRMKAGPSDPPRLAPHELTAVLKDARHLFGSRLATEGIDYEEHVMPATVKADAELLVLAIANIVANAADAMNTSNVKRITVHTELDGNWVALTITDTGPGLSPRDLENLFKPFYTTKPSDEGLGLGLALSAEYLAAMGARIQGGNAPGGGARFCIALPLIT